MYYNTSKFENLIPQNVVELYVEFVPLDRQIFMHYYALQRQNSKYCKVFLEKQCTMEYAFLHICEIEHSHA